MSDLALLAADPTRLDQHADPGAFIELACERAKQWLTQALEQGDIEQIVETKSQAEAMRTYTAQKQLGKDTELAAQEIVRRAERCIGLLIRRGQAGGTITPNGDQRFSRGKSAPTDFVSGGRTLTETYAMTDGVSDEQFDAAIETAKGVGNLSRSNVVRTLTRNKVIDICDTNDTKRRGAARVEKAREMANEGYTSKQIAKALGIEYDSMAEFRRRHAISVPADAVVGKHRSLNSTRIVSAAVAAVDGIGLLFDSIDYDDLDRENVDGWLSVLDTSIRSLTTLKNSLSKRRSQP